MSARYNNPLFQQAEQMITSAFRINSTVQDYQAKQELKEVRAYSLCSKYEWLNRIIFWATLAAVFLWDEIKIFFLICCYFAGSG